MIYIKSLLDFNQVKKRHVGNLEYLWMGKFKRILKKGLVFLFLVGN